MTGGCLRRVADYARNEEALCFTYGDSRRSAQLQISIQLTNGVSEVRLDVDLESKSAQRISFFPPNPVSPKHVAGSDDECILGIGFVSMRIVQ